MSEIVRLTPWNDVSYDEALAEQLRLSRAGRSGWLLFCCPPTITLGRRAKASDVLVDEAELSRRGVRLVRVGRGGEVTYHGPGQLIGFPFGTLEAHVGDSRGVRTFVVGLKSKVERLVRGCLQGDARRLDDSTAEDCAGVWIWDGSKRRKLVSIGLAFGREGISHGFALNVQPLEEKFALINPCGESTAPPQASLFTQPRPSLEFEAVVNALVDILGSGR